MPFGLPSASLRRLTLMFRSVLGPTTEEGRMGWPFGEVKSWAVSRDGLESRHNHVGRHREGTDHKIQPWRPHVCIDGHRVFLSEASRRTETLFA